MVLVGKHKDASGTFAVHTEPTSKGRAVHAAGIQRSNFWHTATPVEVADTDGDEDGTDDMDDKQERLEQFEGCRMVEAEVGTNTAIIRGFPAAAFEVDRAEVVRGRAISYFVCLLSGLREGSRLHFVAIQVPIAAFWLHTFAVPLRFGCGWRPSVAYRSRHSHHYHGFAVQREVAPLAVRIRNSLSVRSNVERSDDFPPNVSRVDH